MNNKGNKTLEVDLEKGDQIEKLQNKIKLLEEQLKCKVEELKSLNSIIETMYDGVIIVDKEGKVTMISDTYKKFLGINKCVIGKHVTEVVENSRMHIVAQTGIEEIAQPHKINGSYMIANRVPLIKEGKVVGALGKVIFRNIKDLNILHDKITNIEQELESYKGEVKNFNNAKYEFADILGKSNEIKETKEIAKRISRNNSNILILGETGTGKELFAHSIHKNSKRCNKAFVKINCAAIPAQLLEAELFGYEKGSFTGANKSGKIGKFELANYGTIFLDEIGDMPLNMQVKLLRVIQEKEVERIGGEYPRPIDVRIIAATNKNLFSLVKENKFREDLYYRLNVITINIPSLKDRNGDIELLANHFLYKFNVENYKNIIGFSKQSINVMNYYSWPGNIRELRNVVERAVNIVDGENIIDLKHLPKNIVKDEIVEEVKSIREVVESAEYMAIKNCLKFTNGNKTKAAEMLNISRVALYDKIKKYSLE
ncbi:sigma 54-interacting transcriptional regulator [Clostridium carnis]